MSNKIKILHVVGKMDPGGIETLLMNVYRNIDRDRFEFHFAVQYEEKGFYDDEIAELGGTVIVQPHPRKGLREFKKHFVRNIRMHGPYDAVHSHIFQFSGYILKVAKELQIPVRISHSHTSQDKKARNVIRSLYGSYMKKLILNHATHLLGCSKPACETLFGLRCWDDPRVGVFRNSIHLQPYENLPADRTALKLQLGITDPSVPVIGHIGRFSHEKNHLFLVECFSQFLNRCPNAQLVLVGEGRLRGQIEQAVREKGMENQVIFLGIRKDIPNIIGAFDLFLLPSLFEGLGIVLIEAQAGGIPCLVSDQVPPEANLHINLMKPLSLQVNPETWADYMTRMIGIERPDWPTRFRSLHKHGYDIRSSVQRLEKIYGSWNA